MKKVVIVVVLLIAFVSYIRWCNRPDNGIHVISKDIVLLEGESITINWDANPKDVEVAIEEWYRLRNR